ncbi:hypothetical protein [Arthrobacter sp. NPDC093139]|uniref:hypothetical protein n=1 Tax=Arthrobacter sp. NPDC093139 TaxID=3363945 RepID=UPI00382D00F3
MPHLSMIAIAGVIGAGLFGVGIWRYRKDVPGAGHSAGTAPETEPAKVGAGPAS